MEEKAVNTMKGGIAEDHAIESRKLVESMQARLSSEKTASIGKLGANAALPLTGPPPHADATAASEYVSLSPFWLLVGLALLPVLFLVFRKRPRL
jgi:hypothetical protein